jgi:hypothetical protein
VRPGGGAFVGDGVVGDIVCSVAAYTSGYRLDTHACAFYTPKAAADISDEQDQCTDHLLSTYNDVPAKGEGVTKQQERPALFGLKMAFFRELHPRFRTALVCD